MASALFLTIANFRCQLKLSLVDLYKLLRGLREEELTERFRVAETSLLPLSSYG
jgi:hypothetical protein